jgi:hypothetical protein
VLPLPLRKPFRRWTINSPCVLPLAGAIAMTLRPFERAPLGEGQWLRDGIILPFDIHPLRVSYSRHENHSTKRSGPVHRLGFEDLPGQAHFQRDPRHGGGRAGRRGARPLVGIHLLPVGGWKNHQRSDRRGGAPCAPCAARCGGSPGPRGRSRRVNVLDENVPRDQADLLRQWIHSPIPAAPGVPDQPATTGEGDSRPASQPRILEEERRANA